MNFESSEWPRIAIQYFVAGGSARALHDQYGKENIEQLFGSKQFKDFLQALSGDSRDVMEGMTKALKMQAIEETSRMLTQDGLEPDEKIKLLGVVAKWTEDKAAPSIGINANDGVVIHMTTRPRALEKEVEQPALLAKPRGLIEVK